MVVGRRCELLAEGDEGPGPLGLVFRAELSVAKGAVERDGFRLIGGGAEMEASNPELAGPEVYSSVIL